MIIRIIKNGTEYRFVEKTHGFEFSTSDGQVSTLQRREMSISEVMKAISEIIGGD